MRAFLLLLAAPLAIAGAQSGDATIARLLEPIRAAHNLPALGAAMVTVGTAAPWPGSTDLGKNARIALAVTGVRKRGTDVAVTANDQWHLGSDTKAMTAVIIASLVERGKLTWDSRLGDIFGDLAPAFSEEFRGITITQLLSHHAGLPANIAWRDIERRGGALTAQRAAAVKMAAATRLESRPGSAYLYSNLGYTIAGAIAERVTGKAWESLIKDVVFDPLGMKSCGFGGSGTPGKVDEPWPHLESGAAAPQNGPGMDNAHVMGPAGIVHCSITDWARFIADQLAGDRGNGLLLKEETYRTLHTPKLGGDYAFGWLVAARPWGGTVLTHAGSNTMNFCVVWLAPEKGFAVLAVTNQGGAQAQAATDAAVGALIQRYVR
ncbi:MAG TPA: serine hydrolase domain-containing protein [Gemmatimonadaceae bacterium]|nr:serine hydrolase domain-containing protein [Gemmatimonadaceae bacterium]